MVPHVTALDCALFAFGLYAEPAFVSTILAVLFIPLVEVAILLALPLGAVTGVARCYPLEIVYHI